MPKVSVILAVYNVAPYLKRCMDSLLHQTLTDIEFIFIDDCSSDNSLEILKEYARNDSRITVIESEENKGAAVARNKGLKVAKGEYLGFIDPDDAIDLNYYEELYRVAKEKNVDIAKCGRKTIMPNGDVEISTLNNHIKENNNVYSFSFEWTTAIYRTAFVKQHNIIFPEECPKAQDIVFLARVVYKNATFALVDNVYYYYYKRQSGSLDSSSIPTKHIKSALKAINYVLDEINNSDISERDLDLYISLYSKRLCVVFYTLFQNKTFEAKKLCAEALIKFFYECKNVEMLIKYFPYPWMLKYITKNNFEKLAVQLKKCKKGDLSKPLTWYQKIFCVKNDARKKYKLLYLFGIKISIKRHINSIENTQDEAIHND